MADRGRTPALLALSTAILLASLPGRADDAVLARIMAGLAAQPSREAGFHSVKHLASLSAPVASEGRLIFRKPDHIEQVTMSPRPERLVIDADSAEMSAPGVATRHIDLDDAPALRILADTLRGALSGNLDVLKRHFIVDETGSLSQWRIRLRPAGNVTAQIIQRAYIDGIGATVGQIDIVQANGDEQRITITK